MYCVNVYIGIIKCENSVYNNNSVSTWSWLYKPSGVDTVPVLYTDPLNQQWFGRVWMNPPYGPKPVVTAFMNRMAEHNHGTALLFARTETELFFNTIWDKATSIMFLKGRPHFCHEDGLAADHNSGAPVCLIAYGEDDSKILESANLVGKFIKLK